jgi:hypothetical protein
LATRKDPELDYAEK